MATTATPVLTPSAAPQASTTAAEGSSRTRVRRTRKAHLLQLNACVCGVTITDGEIQQGDTVMRCRVPGCETVWVSAALSLYHYVLQLMKFSFTKIVWTMNTHRNSGPVKAARQERREVAAVVMRSSPLCCTSRFILMTNFRKNKYTCDLITKLGRWGVGGGVRDPK